LDIDALTWQREHTFREWRLHLAKFFVSLINASDSIYGGNVKFGWNSECQNNVYRTIIDPRSNGATVNSATVSISKEGGGVIASGTGKITKMLYPGRYIASASANGLTFANQVFVVSSGGQIIIISAGSGQPEPGHGILNGDVLDAETNRAIAGAEINAYSGTSLVKSSNTGALGSYEMTLAAGSYRIDISAPNYKAFSNYLTVEDGRVHYMEALLLVEDIEGNGTATGFIRNATNSQPLSGVNLVVTSGWGNANGVAITRANTDEDGKYNLALPYGNYTVIMSLAGYVSDSFNIIVKQSPSEKHATLSPAQESGEYRVVLTWGVSPDDLDSHLTANGGVHIYYSDMESANAWLDVDDTTSYGPETITISNLAALGGFKFSVHDYTNRGFGTTQLSSSGATVRVYHENELLRTYFVPTGQSGTVWNVFSIDANGWITDLNSFEYQSNPELVGNGGLMRTSRESEGAPLKEYEIEQVS
jgi:hypothetical protein